MVPSSKAAPNVVSNYLNTFTAKRPPSQHTKESLRQTVLSFVENDYEKYKIRKRIKVLTRTRPSSNARQRAKDDQELKIQRRRLAQYCEATDSVPSLTSSLRLD